MINSIVNNGIRPEAQADVDKTVDPGRPATVDVQPAAPEPKEKADESTSVAPDPAELTAAVSRLNDHVQNIQRTLAFSIEETTGTMVVQVYDSQTDELIRQIPAEETIKLAASIEGRIANLLLQEQA